MAKRKASELESLDKQSSLPTLENGTPSSTPSKRRKKMDEELIDEVNEMSINIFEARHIHTGALDYFSGQQDSSRGFRMTLKAAAELTKDEFNDCFQLIESTSRQDYEPSSWGWHPKRKKREMREDEMRYLLVRPVDTDKQSASTGNKGLGFASFMLTHDSTPSVPVLYIYEIHLAPSLRKCGLGAHLMHTMESTAASVGVEKVMLTCFVSNEKARSFYRRRGYVTDADSPEDRTTRNTVVKADYVIMSKTVEGELAETDSTASSDYMRCSVSTSRSVSSEKSLEEDLVDRAERESIMSDTHNEGQNGAGKSYNSTTSAPKKAWQTLFRGKLGVANKENHEEA